ncbi:MAG TPA: ATP-binding cassette domain-containing protein, partial [Steroidobacteraceae bacterium]|nr:ATP-binding cassette domain-containing protein [Steroidobacteraceae bacterium]
MKQLSGGMKQKLGLVCTLIHAPELIILDEPTTGVDPVSRRDFWSILGGLLQERGITALISTAYMDEASRFQRVALMFGGKLLAADTPAAMARRVHGSTVTISVRGLAASRVEEDLQRLRKSYEQTDLSGTTLRVFADGCTPEEAQDRIGALLPEMAKEMLSSDVPTLEDTFIALVREQGLQQLARETASTMAFGGQPVATSSPGAAIEARELTRDFGAFRAVDRVSFSVPPGQIFGLLGANGAGKSTVIKMLTGILRPTGGRGRVAGADMQSAGWGIKERIGYMSQAFSLYLDLTVAENLRLYAGIYGLSPELMQERLEWALDMAGLRALRDRRAAALPMGQRQRLALGCALMHRPRVLFLDEPTSGVDPIGRRTFWELLYRLSREEHVAILVTTHYMSEAENCDHLALLYAGRIVADDTPEGMKAAVEREAGRLLEVSGVDAQAAIQSLAPQYPHATLFGDRIHLFSRDGERDAEQIAALLAHANLGAARVTFQRLTMEDVFVYRVTELEAAARKAA